MSEPRSGIQVSKKQSVSSPLTRKYSILCGDRASDRHGSNSVSEGQCLNNHSSYHSQAVLLAQFSLHVHKGGLKPYSFHFCS